MNNEIVKTIKETEKEIFVCNHCQEEYNNINNMLNHLTTHHYTKIGINKIMKKIETNVFKTPCNCKFCSIDAAERHIRIQNETTGFFINTETKNVYHVKHTTSDYFSTSKLIICFENEITSLDLPTDEIFDRSQRSNAKYYYKLKPNMKRITKKEFVKELEEKFKKIITEYSENDDDA
jgi:hypothetical protein